MRKINRAVKIRIYPNKEQITQIEKTIGCSRFLYNRMLADKIRYYQEEKKMLKNTPAGYKKEYPWLKEVDDLEKQTETVSQTLQNVFDFMEAAFGDSQEMVAFITELNANFYSIWFIRENGSDQYYRHNKGLLFDDRQKLILGQMEELESTMKRGITDGV